jgi:hypothetical protein
MMRFHFKPPFGVQIHKDYKGQTLLEAQEEIRELREWLSALTEQLEYVIGKEDENGD